MFELWHFYWHFQKQIKFKHIILDCKGKWLVTIYPKSIRILHSTHKLTCILGNQFIRPALILDMIKLFATVAIVMCNEIVALTYIRYTGWIDDYINIQCVIDKYTSDVRFTVHHFCRRTLVWCKWSSSMDAICCPRMYSCAFKPNTKIENINSIDNNCIRTLNAKIKLNKKRSIELMFQSSNIKIYLRTHEMFFIIIIFNINRKHHNLCYH